MQFQIASMKKLFNNIITHLSLIYKIVAMVVTSVLILLMFPHTDRATHYNYSVGSFWNDDDLYAPYDFAVQKSENEVEQEEQNIRQQSLLFYSIDSSAHSNASKRLDNSTLGWQEKKQARYVLDAIYRIGYIEQPADVNDFANHTIVVLSGTVGAEHIGSDYITPNRVEEYVVRYGWGTHNDADIESRAELLRREILVPSICYDPIRTQLELDSRLSQIKYDSRMVQMGELIVAKGEYISEEKGQILASLENENNTRFASHYNATNHYIGQFLLCIIAFVALYMFLKIVKHHILDDDRKITFVLFSILMMAGFVALIERINPDLVLLAPVCMIPILMRVFFDMRVALYIELTTVIILGNLVPNSFEFIFYQLVTGMMSIVTVKGFERRSNFFIVSIAIFVTYSVIYTAGMLSQDTNLHGLDIQRYLIFFFNALLTLLSYPLIYIFEKVFGMTTALTLLEISSTNTPALRELSRRAPGTFQHCMQVANISEDVINEIGGNALLARVGALYHDIGKIKAPLYFTENQNTGLNPHNKLDYEESAQIITQHVRDGIELAKQYRLPNEVTDFIRTHHGTTRTGYFYTMWLNSHPGMTPDPTVFQYAGPAPFSRETAVVMLVDSVEAATHSLKEPTRENIQKMVNNIIDSKISDKQLNYCNITFGDITRIRELLAEKMANIYHVRVEYPTVKGQPDTAK